MKIGILSLPNSISYGASLQTFALREYLEIKGCDAEVINYLPNIILNKKSKSSNLIKKTCIDALTLRKKMRFRSFERKIRKYPRHSIGKEYLSEMSKRYDYMICGSDQIWNPHITGWDYSYFFDFCNDSKKKISYAPSFGVEELPKDYSDTIAGLLSNFNCISVRESDGARIVNSLIHLNPVTVLDPTFLIPKDRWKTLEKKTHISNQGYVLLFMLKYSDAMISFANRLAQEKGLKLSVIGGSFFEHGKYQKYNYNLVGPSQWLFLFDHADYIVTNSFHGVAFSVIFRKQFFTEYSAITNTRLYEIVSKFNLSSQLINNNNETYHYLDYLPIEKLISSEIEKSEMYLKKALGVQE